MKRWSGMYLVLALLAVAITARAQDAHQHGDAAPASKSALPGKPVKPAQTAAKGHDMDAMHEKMKDMHGVDPAARQKRMREMHEGMQGKGASKEHVHPAPESGK